MDSEFQGIFTSSDNDYITREIWNVGLVEGGRLWHCASRVKYAK